MMPSFKPSPFANAEIEKIYFLLVTNFWIACTKNVSRIKKRTMQIIKKPIPHHLGRYLLNNDTFVRDGAVTEDIEQIRAEFFAVRPVADFVSL